MDKDMTITDEEWNSVKENFNKAKMIVEQRYLLRDIQDYLEGGGLFNPELANHDNVRDLIINCRNFIQNVKLL